MSALITSIVAGSCCLVELTADLTHSANVTRRCLYEALDRTAYVAVGVRPPAEVLNRCLIVDQTGSTLPSVGRRVLRSRPQSGAVALVDRTANLELAAEEIINARTLFSGNGPYAPIYILVNEFVEQDLIRFVGKHAGSTANNTECADTNVLLNERGIRLVKVNKRDIQIDRPERTEAIGFLTTSSHDDAIDTLNISQQDPLLAAYIFADPPTAKYLAQFIRSNATFVNHIPANLLLGPAAPEEYHVNPVERYHRDMMKTPSPKFSTRVPGALSLQDLLSDTSGLSQAFHNRSLKPPKTTGQPKEGDKNFFTQGFLTGVICLVLPLVAGTLFGTYHVSKSLYKLSNK